MEKTVTLFNKNHISIVRRERAKKEQAPIATRESRSFGGPAYNFPRDAYEKTEKVSKLGFFYTKYEYVSGRNKCAKGTGVLDVYKIGTSLYEYTVTYLIESNGTRVSAETRPWMLSEGKSMNDHYVKDLLKIVEGIFSEAKSSNTVYTSIYGTVHAEPVAELKKILYGSLFGDPNGPRFMTDEEKILSHGFDLKTSFRKGKEK